MNIQDNQIAPKLKINLPAFFKNKLSVFFIILIMSTISLPYSATAENKILSVQKGFPLEKKNSNFSQIEVAYRLDLPWHSYDGNVFSGIRLTAGMLSEDDDHGIIFSIGPVLGIYLSKSRTVFQGGISVAGLGKSQFNGHNLGGKVQFISHIGMGVRISNVIGLMLGFQHMSNGSLQTNNPGLNLLNIKLCRWFQ